jgi:hypothetical protein
MWPPVFSHKSCGTPKVNIISDFVHRNLTLFICVRCFKFDIETTLKNIQLKFWFSHTWTGWFGTWLDYFPFGISSQPVDWNHQPVDWTQATSTRTTASHPLGMPWSSPLPMFFLWSTPVCQSIFVWSSVLVPLHNLYIMSEYFFGCSHVSYVGIDEIT